MSEEAPRPRRLTGGDGAIGWILSGLVVGGAFAASLPALRATAGHDADRYYHVAISRESAARGLLRTLPQVVDLGWDRSFPDKEFLFHVLTTLAYRAGGEAGVYALGEALAGALVLATFLVAARLSTPWLGAAATVVTLLLTPEFLVRLSFLRPHLLAVTIFVLMVLGLHERRSWLTAGLGLAYALAYHALYVPLLLFGLWAVVERAGSGRWPRAAVAGALGLAVGAVADPYALGKVQLTWEILRIALRPGDALVALGGPELRPWRSDEIVRKVGFHLAVVGGSLVGAALGGTWWRSRLPIAEEGPATREAAVTLVAGALWALLLVNPRTLEYAVPVTALVLAATVWQARPFRLWVLAFAALAAVSQVPAGVAGRLAPPGPSERTREALAAVERIPPGDRDAKVFTCEWHSGAFVLYGRPDLRVSDVLDPRLLARAAPALFEVRLGLNDGLVPDASWAIRTAFASRYALCEDPDVTTALDADPDVQRLYPAGGPPRPGPIALMSLFALAEERAPAFLRRFEQAAVSGWAAPGLAEGRSSAGLAWQPMAPGPEGSVYQNLATLPGPAAGGEQCMAVRPAALETRRRAGATWLGIGGGPRVAVWVDGELLFTGAYPSERLRPLSHLVPLPRAIGEGTGLLATVCRPRSEAGWGLAWSLWTTAELEAVCQRKGRPAFTTLPGIASSAPEATCLAPIAVPRWRSGPG